MSFLRRKKKNSKLLRKLKKRKEEEDYLKGVNRIRFVLSNTFGLRSFLHYDDKEQLVLLALHLESQATTEIFVPMQQYYNGRELVVLLVVHGDLRRYYGMIWGPNKTFGGPF